MSFKTWLSDRPWIWIVLLLALLLVGSVATFVIAELNRPEILNRPAGPPAVRGLGVAGAEGVAQFSTSRGNEISIRESSDRRRELP